jgi:hypothetical protein
MEIPDPDTCSGSGRARARSPGWWARVVGWAVVASVPALGSCSHADAPPNRRWVPRPPPGLSISYAQWQQKSVHNAYDQPESVAAQLGQHRFRSVEFDIHSGKRGRGALPGDWFVYHVDFPGFDGSSCSTLSQCLGQVAAYHRSSPAHEVLTIFVDLKDALASPSHGPAQLDALLRASLPVGALLEPRDLLERCPGASTLRAAVTGACSWPVLAELSGKIAVVLTGGDICAGSARLPAYVAGGPEANQRAAFVAPNVSDRCPFERYDDAPYAVYFNLDRESLRHAAPIALAGLVSRAYHGGVTGGLNEPETWGPAAEAGVQFLVTDRVDEARYPWTDSLGVVGDQLEVGLAAREAAVVPGKLTALGGQLGCFDE